jgi:hypothetical protein
MYVSRHSIVSIASARRTAAAAAAVFALQVSYTPDLGAHQEYFLGAGGVFNLYTSLTGEELPGATDAAAQVGGVVAGLVRANVGHAWLQYVICLQRVRVHLCLLGRGLQICSGTGG